jgi:hypothetical protein
MLRYVLAWFPMIAIAVANGAFREGWLAPRMDHHSAQQPLWVGIAPYVFRRLLRATATS